MGINRAYFKKRTPNHPLINKGINSYLIDLYPICANIWWYIPYMFSDSGIISIEEKELAVFKTVRTFTFLVLALAAIGASAVHARPKMLKGPIPAFVERVIDGDTLVVRARIWLGQELRVKVRIHGIDAPELRSRCLKEHELAVSARHLVKQLVGQRKISLSHIRQGKYAGRVVAKVTDTNGSSLSTPLLKANLARPYFRGRRKSWCGREARPYRKAHLFKKAHLRSMVKTVSP